jgi:hypothetical protein
MILMIDIGRRTHDEGRHRCEANKCRLSKKQTPRLRVCENECARSFIPSGAANGAP